MARSMFSTSAVLVGRVLYAGTKPDSFPMLTCAALNAALGECQDVADLVTFEQMTLTLAKTTLTRTEKDGKGFRIVILGLGNIEKPKITKAEKIALVSEKTSVPPALYESFPEDAIDNLYSQFAKAEKEDAVYRIYAVCKGDKVIAQAITQKTIEEFEPIVFRELASS